MLDIIDRYVWRKGGLLFRLWFRFEKTGRYDEDSGAEYGRVVRRVFPPKP